MNERPQQNKPRPSTGPKISVVLTPMEISSKEVKVKAKILNAQGEKTLRFSLNGFLSSDCVKPTQSSEAEFTFSVPKNTTEARIKAEVMDGSRVFDEVQIPIPPADEKQPAKKDSKEPRVQISGPSDAGIFFVSIITAQAKEKVVISSDKELTIVPKGKKSVSGNNFVFSSGPDKILLLEIRFEGQKVICFFNGQKRMLIR